MLAFGLAGVCEWSLRRAGHRPSFDDDPTMWALQRKDVEDDPRAIALLGSSRMLLAISREVFESERTGHRVVQLSINGTAGLGSLEDLAADPNFNGTAILDLAEWDVTSKAWSGQDRWVSQHDRLWRAPGALANAWLRGRVRDRVVVIGLDGRLVLSSVLQRRSWPEQRWVITEEDRFRAGDYARASKKSLSAARRKNRDWVPEHPPSPAAWLAEMARLEHSVQRIQARGGRVVIIRMPTSGEQWRRANERYPRELYWDRFAETTKAVAIHFKDVPMMAAIECPDEAHLDQRDQARFTRALVSVLRDRGLLR